MQRLFSEDAAAAPPRSDDPDDEFRPKVPLASGAVLMLYLKLSISPADTYTSEF